MHAGHFSIAADPATISLIFYRSLYLSGETGLTGQMVRTPSAAVAMSPILAKNFVKLLGQAIGEYEKAHGTIPDIIGQPDIISSR
jgi:hypothetical protein